MMDLPRRPQSGPGIGSRGEPGNASELLRCDRHDGHRACLASAVGKLAHGDVETFDRTPTASPGLAAAGYRVAHVDVPGCGDTSTQGGSTCHALDPVGKVAA